MGDEWSRNKTGELITVAFIRERFIFESEMPRAVHKDSIVFSIVFDWTSTTTPDHV